MFLRMWKADGIDADCRLYSIGSSYSNSDFVQTTVSADETNVSVGFDESSLTGYAGGYYAVGCFVPTGSVIYGIRYVEP